MTTEMNPAIRLDKDLDLIPTEQGTIFNPYNSVNIKITTEDVQTVLSKYGLPPVVRNLDIFQRAFVHRSYVKRPQYENDELGVIIAEKPDDCLPLSTKHNERLEFLGDGILECVTKLYLYKRFPKENEGFMTDKKIAIVKNEAIGRIALEMGLHKWLIISRHAEDKKIRSNLKKLGCLFEAFIGAVFLNFETHNPEADDEDGSDLECESPGFKMAKKFINCVFKTHIDWTSLLQNDDNYKNILQVKIQKEFKVTPHYLIIDLDAELGYHMGVYLCLGSAIHGLTHADATPIAHYSDFEHIHKEVEERGKVLIFMGEGLHKIKRKAEQTACEDAIKYLNTFNK